MSLQPIAARPNQVSSAAVAYDLKITGGTIDAVFVNGRITRQNGNETGTLPGLVLRDGSA